MLQIQDSKLQILKVLRLRFHKFISRELIENEKFKTKNGNKGTWKHWVRVFTWSNQDDQMNLTEPWQRETLTIEFDQNWNRQTYWNRRTLTLRLGSPNIRAWCFFLVGEQSNRASEAGQVSQPVQACQPGLGDLSKLTTPAYFLGVKLMFVSVVNFVQVLKIRFVKNFGHVLTLLLVIFINHVN